jgi:hypothetical protein
MFHVGKRGRGSCEHLWLGFQDPPCCVSLQHHIQNYHMVFTFLFNLWDGGVVTHWARDNDFMHCHNDETSFEWIPMPLIVIT